MNGESFPAALALRGEPTAASSRFSPPASRSSGALSVLTGVRNEPLILYRSQDTTRPNTHARTERPLTTTTMTKITPRFSDRETQPYHAFLLLLLPTTRTIVAPRLAASTLCTTQCVVNNAPPQNRLGLLHESRKNNTPGGLPRAGGRNHRRAERRHVRDDTSERE